ncbi:hypothetical protein DL240_18905 [Lujinxingia litoralis]|uniref:Uncharacterized protein n=1 Tax=Lujinxingia litoralis TaxID=2211119 RepID=A0A328C500_9DELT|nr:hypothetical protein [Lujinxingia litoralis]RAL20100.1 hypothetical protein DL240_18905 [Lujinxingia litoralis]
MRGEWLASVGVWATLLGCAPERESAEATLEAYPVVSPAHSPQALADESRGLERFLPATQRAESEAQCVTVLKEVAFCSEEDVFLATLGQTRALSREAAREAFLGQAERWFDPGEARRDCQRIVQATGGSTGPGRALWGAASVGSARVCSEFARTLVEVSFFDHVGQEIWGAR